MMAQQVVWMVPPPVPNCPPGLEYLTQVDQLLIHQEVRLLEVFTGWEQNNKYAIKNGLGQRVYLAAEDNDCCTRQFCGAWRSFDMHIMDHTGNKVISLNRPLRCDSCLFPCCLQEVEVCSPPGNVIGRIQQTWSVCVPKYDVLDAAGNPVLKVHGPFCTWSCCGDIEFPILTADGSAQVGKITKQWSGLAKELFTDADNFGVQFPMDLDATVKATLLGAVFLIDFMFFEKTKQDEVDTPGML